MLFAATALLLVAGVAAWMADAGAAATAAWMTATVVGLAYSTGSLVAAARRREPSVDVIAWLALVGALLVDEAFAGAVIAVMLASGVLLEARAAARARRELSAAGGAGAADRPPADADRAGPRSRSVTSWSVTGCWSGPGEIVPVDGRLLGRGGAGRVGADR